jgi:acetamidase/formamidase
MRIKSASLVASFLLAVDGFPAMAQNDLSGRYTVSTIWGDATGYSILQLEQKGDKLTGTYRGNSLEGTRHDNVIDFTSHDKEGNSDAVHLVAKGSIFTGTDTHSDGSGHVKQSPTLTVTATLATSFPPSAGQTREFVPTEFQHAFSASTRPAMTIAPGDTVHTTTVDAGGTDSNGTNRTFGGNPETGPFYIQGAMPGDTLAVHIVRLRLNRDWAISDDYLDGRSVDPNLAVTQKDTGKTIYWHLDPTSGVASAEKPDTHLANYRVPLRPILGCIATAAPAAFSAPNSGDSGSFGGNMDFNEIVEGATVYLPVRIPGALLYVGDGHAAMGDGELNGNGLETSMDVTFRVELIPRRQTPSPRVENADRIMALGYEGSVDDSLKAATSNMANWLTTDYKLNPSEVAQILGTASQIRITEVADRNAGVAIIIDKDRLKGLAVDK